MLSFNATQLSIVQSSYKKVSWLFTVVDSAGPTTYYWSTITRSYGGHDFTFKIAPDSFNGITLNRAKSEFGIQAPNDLAFTISNSENTLTASNFIDGSVTLDLVVSDDINESTIATWKFSIKRCEAEYQTLRFTCEDFIRKYLEGDYPSQIVKDISPSDDPDRDDLCVPVPVGTCYIPLRSIYITDKRYYLLGPTSGGKTYTISKVHAPRKRGNSEWDSGSYSFTQSTKTIDTVDWRVFQAIIADSNGDGSADANGLWLDGEYFLDMLTKFSRSDSSGKTGPADAIEFILEDMGIASADIDTGAGSSFESAGTTFTSWGLTFNGGYFYGKPKEQILAQLLIMCHSTLQITDKIELHVLSKTSQKTITKADVLRAGDKGPGTFRYSLITEKQSDSGYISFQVVNKPQDEFIKKLVPAKATTDKISNEILEIPFVQDTQDAQRIGSLYYQRLLLSKANISFTNKGGSLLALQPSDMITINHADYGGNYPVLIDSITIRRDLIIDFNCIQFSDSLDDWTDLSPSVITPETDDSTVYWNASGNRVFSVQPYPPYDVGDIWMQGAAGDIKKCITARSSGAYQAGDWGLASEYDKTSTHGQGWSWITGSKPEQTADKTSTHNCLNPGDYTASNTANNTKYVHESDTESGHAYDVYGDLRMRGGADISFYGSPDYSGGIYSSGANILLFSLSSLTFQAQSAIYIKGDLLPDTNTYQLGSSSYAWAKAYFANDAKVYFNKSPSGTADVLTMNSSNQCFVGGECAACVLGQSCTVNDPVYIRVNGSNAQQVTVGVADSGGTDYRLLRVPN